MEANLSFNNYNVIETIYKFNPESSLESEDVTTDFSLKIVYEDNERQNAALYFTVELGDFQLNQNSFYTKAVIVGHFSINADEEVSAAFIDHMYKKLPYLFYSLI
ncbi:hypothetical protein ACUL41_13395 [Virgibacillus natechei]